MNLERARKLDQEDSLAKFRSEFLFPTHHQNKDVIYLAGNSLGLQPRKTKDYINEVLEDWKILGVEGHIKAKNPWLPYHEFLTQQLCELTGAKPIEVCAMGSLTSNLHFLMVSFYRPSKSRFKILIEKSAFPSDQYAVASQIKFHGFDVKDALIEVGPRPGEDLIRIEDFEAQIEKHRDSLALALIGNVNYLTGQYFPIKRLTERVHQAGAYIGFDLAHGIGNLELHLHDDGPDFAAWCSYKYLNSGPGGIAGIFVHERHAQAFNLPRFAGWWGHNKSTRFLMGPTFDPIAGAEGWQLSNPPIFQLAALRASLDVFSAASMKALRKKSMAITEFFKECLEQNKKIKLITPANPEERGTQFSLRISGDAKKVCTQLFDQGVVCDYREPGILRAAPAPLYTRYEDVVRFLEILGPLL